MVLEVPLHRFPARRERKLWGSDRKSEDELLMAGSNTCFKELEDREKLLGFET